MWYQLFSVSLRHSYLSLSSLGSATDDSYFCSINCTKFSQNDLADLGITAFAEFIGKSSIVIKLLLVFIKAKQHTKQRLRISEQTPSGRPNEGYYFVKGQVEEYPHQPLNCLVSFTCIHILLKGTVFFALIADKIGRKTIMAVPMILLACIFLIMSAVSTNR